MIGCPLEDDWVRRMIKTDIHDTDNVRRWVAPSKTANDVFVNILVTYEAKHGLGPSVLFAPATWHAIQYC